MAQATPDGYTRRPKSRDGTPLPPPTNSQNDDTPDALEHGTATPNGYTQKPGVEGMDGLINAIVALATQQAGQQTQLFDASTQLRTPAITALLQRLGAGPKPAPDLSGLADTANPFRKHFSIPAPGATTPPSSATTPTNGSAPPPLQAIPRPPTPSQIPVGVIDQLIQRGLHL